MGQRGVPHDIPLDHIVTHYQPCLRICVTLVGRLKRRIARVRQARAEAEARAQAARRVACLRICVTFIGRLKRRILRVRQAELKRRILEADARAQAEACEVATRADEGALPADHKAQVQTPAAEAWVEAEAVSEGGALQAEDKAHDFAAHGYPDALISNLDWAQAHTDALISNLDWAQAHRSNSQTHQ